MNLNPDAALTLSGALAAGIVSMIIARHLRSPGIIILLFAGVALGPDGIGWIVPANLGALLPMIVGMAVAVILFEGGLHLELSRLRTEGAVINRLITIGALVTAVLGTFVGLLVMDWGWELSILFGTLIIVTGPTVVTPLLRRIKLKQNLQTILEAEGVLIDPLGAIFAIVALDFVVTAAESSILAGLGLFFVKLLFGTLIGVVGGLTIGWFLKQERLVPDELENIFTLGFVLFLFEASDAVLHESGIMTVTIAGMVVGNMQIPMHRQLVEFKEQLTIMLIGVLFILLAADVRLADIEALGTAGLLAAAAVMFIVRPINVASCTMKSNLNWREKLFLSWLAPRGIVAAAVASLFATDLAESGIYGGESLRALVFLIIASTVVLQGFTAGPLAAILKLRRESNNGYLIVGANPLGIAIGRQLEQQGEEIVFIDRNEQDCKEAKKAGFKIIYGNALEEHVLERAKPETRRGVIGLTPNEGVNLMLMRRVSEMTSEPDNYITLSLGSAIEKKMIDAVNGHVIFASQIDFDLWTYLHRQGLASIETWKYEGSEPFVLSPEVATNRFGPSERAMLPLAVFGDKSKTVPAFDGLAVKKGQKIVVMMQSAECNACHKWLTDAQFGPAS